ncbi:MAG: hypothetical protein JW818_16995, partial [Pirellulales bacterium]|nr:hypothetical protein [Pirellulales bacterium]
MPRQNTMWRIRPVVVGVVLMLSGLVGVGVDAAEQAAAQRVKFVLDQLDSRRGVGVLVGEGAAGLAEEMARQSELTLYVHLPTESDVKATCARLDDTGLLGTRVFVGRGGPESIPLATSLSDFVLVEPEQVLAAKPHVDELTRVVRPLGKVFVGDEIQTKPYPAEADNWTHAYHGPDNNPQSTDQLARGTLQTQFLGPPWYVPFPVVTVTSAGRVFRAYGHVGFKERDWPWLNKLVAFNGYNGT